ncbi:serralysin-like metalloprotease domain-containing protein (plasmid) [Rhizobium phaseoli]|nr:serralysin-like metalloprotease domain-containing protein [Rhizobium phaseoli]
MVFAGAGNDIVSVGGGSDIVSLGAGDDLAHFVMPPLDNGSSQVQTVIWGGDGADSFYFADNTYVLSVSVDGITEDLLKNLSTSALFSLFNYDNEWSYDYIIINLEQQDKIFVEGTEITNAVVVQDIENEDTGFVFDYTFDHHGNDGWDWHYSESMTRTETRSQMDYFDTPGFDQTALSGGANGLVAIFGHFVLEGFVDGAAGIHFVGDGITGRLEVTTTVQQINVTSSDTTTREFAGTDGADTIQGTSGRDVIYGYGGSDTIFAKGGDHVEAGSGNDVIHAGDGSNDLYGGTGSDTVIFDGPRSSYILSVYDDVTVQIDGPNTTIWVEDGEWLVFDDPDSEVDEIVNIDDFLNGDTGSSAAEGDVATTSTHVAAPESVSIESASGETSEASLTASAEIISFPMINTMERHDIQPIALESAAHGDGANSEFSADVISLQDFMNSHEEVTSDSDLWFEPEPIGSVI